MTIKRSNNGTRQKKQLKKIEDKLADDISMQAANLVVDLHKRGYLKLYDAFVVSVDINLKKHSVKIYADENVTQADNILYKLGIPCKAINAPRR